MRSTTEEVTPIRVRTHSEERQLLSHFVAHPPDTILIVSDLHLGIGRDPLTGAYSIMENFLADEAFERWLQDSLPRRERSSALILNGDVFDFLRITRCPETGEEYTFWSERLAWLGEGRRAQALEQQMNRAERRYGLRTHDYKTLWKLLLIFRGHERFFAALADWVSAGGILVMVKGNHDLELHWPLIRRAIRDELVRVGAPPQKVEDQVVFADEGFTIGNIYIEHGHQYEAMTRVVGEPVLQKDPGQINFPLGSFVNRYFINKIERFYPFLDNIKPVQHALLALFRRRPLTVLGTYFRAWRFVWRAATSRRFNGAVAVILVGLLVPLLAVGLGVVFLIWPRPGVFPLRYSLESVVVVGVLFPVVLPYLVGACRELLLQIGLLRPRDHLEEGARSLLPKVFPPRRKPERVYAVMGHTHVQAVRQLASSPREEFYVNTGTWIPLWPQERQDLIGRVVYSFTRFTLNATGEYRHEALEWDDQATESRPARLVV